MTDKYSFAKCEQYGRRLAARLCQQHVGTQPDATLDGPALLQLTPLRQVNLLVLHQLLGRWQQEAARLRSPYFDFEAEPVRAALGQFMNVLSRHISVGREALEPLLAQAVAYTLLLATDANAAFEHLLLPPADPDEPNATVPLDYLRERLRYLDQAKTFFEGFVNSLPSGNAPLDREFLVQRLDLYRATHYQELPALAPLVAELSTLLPLTEADLWDDGPAPKPVVVKVEPTAATPPPAPSPTDFVEDQATPEVIAPEPPAAEAATPEPEPQPAPAPTSPAPPTRPIVVPSFVTAPAAEAEAPAGVPLYEKLKAGRATGAHLAEALRDAAPTGAPSLAERAAPKVGSMREAISINQRYSFINELFNGENMEYHAAIEQLDKQPTAAEAAAYVQQELAPRYDWSRKEEHVGKLLKLIERKFAGA